MSWNGDWTTATQHAHGEDQNQTFRQHNTQHLAPHAPTYNASFTQRSYAYTQYPSHTLLEDEYNKSDQNFQHQNIPTTQYSSMQNAGTSRTQKLNRNNSSEFRSHSTQADQGQSFPNFSFVRKSEISQTTPAVHRQHRMNPRMTDLPANQRSRDILPERPTSTARLPATRNKPQPHTFNRPATTVNYQPDPPNTYSMAIGGPELHNNYSNMSNSGAAFNEPMMFDRAVGGPVRQQQNSDHAQISSHHDTMFKSNIERSRIQRQRCQSGVRVITSSVEGLHHWANQYAHSVVMFELYSKLVWIKYEGDYVYMKLKGTSLVIDAVFCCIDRDWPCLNEGIMLRSIGKLNQKRNIFQCISARQLTQIEQKNYLKMIKSCESKLNQLQLQHSET